MTDETAAYWAERSRLAEVACTVAVDATKAAASTPCDSRSWMNPTYAATTARHAASAVRALLTAIEMSSPDYRGE